MVALGRYGRGFRSPSTPPRRSCVPASSAPRRHLTQYLGRHLREGSTPPSNVPVGGPRSSTAKPYEHPNSAGEPIIGSSCTPMQSIDSLRLSETGAGTPAQTGGFTIVIGVIERDGGTLYCTSLFLTAAERYLWGRGDGPTLDNVETRPALGRSCGSTPPTACDQSRSSSQEQDRFVTGKGAWAAAPTRRPGPPGGGPGNPARAPGCARRR